MVRCNCFDLVTFQREILTEEDFMPLEELADVNSWRYYSGSPTELMAGVRGVVYREATPVLDVVELLPKLKSWAVSSSQRMGNWVSGEEIIERIGDFEIEEVPVTRGRIPLGLMNEILKEDGTITIIGFDVLQAPRCRIEFTGFQTTICFSHPEFLTTDGRQAGFEIACNDRGCPEFGVRHQIAGIGGGWG